MTQAPERLRHTMQHELRVHPLQGGSRRRQRAAAGQPGIDGVIRELRLVLHHCAVHVGSGERPIRRDDEFDDDREPILVIGEGGEIRRKLLRQHREDHRRRVHRCRVDLGMAIDRRSLEYGSVDIGDGDENLHAAAREGVGDRQLIEVSRVVVIDRAPQRRAQVAQRSVGRPRRRVQTRDFGEGVGRKLGLEAVRAHRLDGNGDEMRPVGSR